MVNFLKTGVKMLVFNCIWRKHLLYFEQIMVLPLNVHNLFVFRIYFVLYYTYGHDTMKPHFKNLYICQSRLSFTKIFNRRSYCYAS